MAITADAGTKRPLRGASVWRRYGYLWVTAALFLLSLVGHWWLSWSAYVDEQQSHGEVPQVSGYLVQTGRDTLENWQSEFLQLLWQVAGLSFLLSVGSPQSREEDERLEEKLDAVLRAVRPDEADRIIADLDSRYDRT
jgi:hypothetical protein